MSDNRNSSYEMAVNLNNATAMTVFEGGGVGSYYPAACHTIKKAIQLIKAVISNEYVDNNVPITTRPCPMSLYPDSNLTTTTSNTSNHMVMVNVVSNCSPCPNFMLQSTVHRPPPPPAEDSTTSRLTTPIDKEGSQQQRVGSMPMRNASLVEQGRVPEIETRGWIVYLMRIDDYDSTILSGQHPCCQVEYHATVMLYNLAIVNLITGVKKTMTTGRSTCVLPITSSSSMECTTSSCNDNIETTSLILVHDAFHIFHLALSHLKRMVNPYLQYIEDFIRRRDDDDHHHGDSSGIITTTTGWNRSSDDTNHDLYRKCIILMILIHYHIMYILYFQSRSDNNINNNIQQQQQYYEYHRSILNQLASLLSYIELFVIVGGSNNNNSSSSSIPTAVSSSLSSVVNTSNPIQCTSPAA